MTKKDQLKKLLRALIAEEYKGKGAADDSAADIKSLEALIANPPKAFAKKNYGSVERYVAMLKKKLAKLKGSKSVDESTDYSMPDDSAGVLNVIHDIDDSVWTFIKNADPQAKLSPTWMSPDGDSAFDKNGTINFYVDGINPKVWSQAAKKIKDELEAIKLVDGTSGVTVIDNNWRNVDTSKMTGKGVLRFNIKIDPELVYADLPHAYPRFYEKRHKTPNIDRDEPGRGPEYRVRSDEPSPFGYGDPYGGDPDPEAIGETITSAELKSLVREAVALELRRAKKSAKKR